MGYGAGEWGNRVSGTPPGARREVGRAAWSTGQTRSWLTDLVSVRQRPRRAAGVSYGQPFSVSLLCTVKLGY